MTAAKTLYVDHSIVAKPQYRLLLETLLRGGEYRLVLSLWNLAEMAAATDEVQRAERLEYLQQFSPRWVLETAALKSAEVRRYLWTHRFAQAAPQEEVFFQYLSEVLARSGERNIRIGETPHSWIERFSRQQFKRTKDRAPDALSQLQSFEPDYFRELQARAFPKWVLKSVPNRDPDEKLLTQGEQQTLAEYCTQNKADFLNVCPVMAVEDALSRIRTSNPKRNPKPSDAPDLMHTIAGIAYCDVFLLDDGWAEDCARQAKEELRQHTLAEIHNPSTVASITNRPD